MAVTARGLTLEEFLKLPEAEPALEFVNGSVIQKVSPKGQHSWLQVELVQRVNQFAWPQRRARAFPELRTSFAGASYVPDVAIYREDRLPYDDQGRVANDFREPPDVAIEIVSPEQSVNALVRRCLWYVANGVGVALLVDPSDESVLSFRPGQAPQPLAGADPIDLNEVLPGFALTVRELLESLRLR